MQAPREVERGFEAEKHCRSVCMPNTASVVFAQAEVQIYIYQRLLLAGTLLCVPLHQSYLSAFPSADAIMARRYFVSLADKRGVDMQLTV